MTYWPAIPIVDAPIDRLVWPCHDISPDHLHPLPGQPLTTGPIHLEQLADGSLFIHDGRHRAIRARLAGEQAISARILVRGVNGF